LGLSHDQEKGWFSSGEIIEIAQRSPTKLNPDLSILIASAKADTTSASRQELSKFDLELPNDRSSILFGSSPPVKVSNGSSASPKTAIFFGSFSEPVIADQMT
jgi:hypothetical protein